MHETNGNLVVAGVAVLLAVWSTWAGAHDGQATTEESRGFVIEAYRLRMDGKIDEAEQTLEQELAKKPENAAGWLELARLELQKGVTTRELDSAQQAIEKAVGTAPDSPVPLRWAAHIAVLNGILKSGDPRQVAAEFKKAATAGERAVALDPDDHEARLILVSLYDNNPSDLGGDQARAKHHVEELEKRSPVDGAVARCGFSLENEPEKKLALWQELAEKLGTDPRVHENLAREYAWRGNVEKATLHADQVLALDSRRGQILLDLARAFALEEKFAPAEKFARRYLALDPPAPLSLRAWAHMALGRIQHMRGDPEASAESLAKARELDPYCWFTMTPPPEQLFETPWSEVREKTPR